MSLLESEELPGKGVGLLSLEKDVYFEYSPSRAGVVAAELSHGYCGVVQTDLYAGYNQVFVPEGVVRVGCWDHTVELPCCSAGGRQGMREDT